MQHIKGKLLANALQRCRIHFWTLAFQILRHVFLFPKYFNSTQSPNGNVDQPITVFNEVHLNFSDFAGVDESPIRHVLNTVDDGNNEMNSTDMSKCMTYVAQTATPPLKRSVEVEFSDSEDMLEGIRNVVDKVSIEDTCDALDLMTSNGMRGSW